MIKVSDVIDGKYRVTRVLGAGGMGTVVEAYHETLDTHVAIKFMRSDMVTGHDGTERFLREARALVKLKSHHAVKVFDFGVHRRMPYIVMEHLEGMDMQTMLEKQGPLSATDAARHIRHACEAIAEAHSLGIYHRDLKPANLFLARGASGKIVVKVLDFGIAKMMRPTDEKPSRYTSLTGANILMGTLSYMSPEQIMSPKNVDARSDIWSLGVVLYELVTGELPFRGRDLYEVQQAIRHEACLLPALPSSLEPVIRRCLEKDPADRYPSAEDLAKALRPLVQETFSPFGTTSIRTTPRVPENVVIRSATASPIPGTGSELDLAIAEGLAPSPHNAATVHERRASATPEATKLDAMPVPDSAEATTRRIPRAAELNQTVRMNQETPEPPTVKRSPSDRPVEHGAQTLVSSSPAGNAQGAARKPALPHFQAHVMPVRRGVLVVQQPLQMSRRQRGKPRRGRMVMGTLMLCVLFFGWNAYGKYKTEMDCQMTVSP